LLQVGKIIKYLTKIILEKAMHIISVVALTHANNHILHWF